MNESSGEEAEASSDPRAPDGPIARKYPELYAEQMALLEAKHRFVEYSDDLKAGITLGRRELLNLYRVRWMTAHFASRLGRAGVYNTAELDAFTYDPLVDADMQRVMDGVRGMRRKLQILAIRRAALAVWENELEAKFRDAQAREEARIVALNEILPVRAVCPDLDILLPTMSTKRNHDEAIGDGEDDNSGDTNQSRRVRTASPGISDEAVAGGEDNDSGDTNEDRRVHTALPGLADITQRVNGSDWETNEEHLDRMNDQLVQWSMLRSDMLRDMQLKSSELHVNQKVINNIEVEMENLQEIQDFTLQLGPVITGTGLYSSEESMEMENEVLDPLAVEMDRLISVRNRFIARRDRIQGDLIDLEMYFNWYGAESEDLRAKCE
ncbi:hypothetical protein UCDDS831_g07218 [Diplodia seriata]|uniref:Uncharacterized protein n=1 Tax=Diplodia seriata TaxID=420778 RepID=A0A0G2E173_9PEZI|nr:hypothetical protein UCDDS831_g07218 [Diplodia seriata]